MSMSCLHISASLRLKQVKLTSDTLYIQYGAHYCTDCKLKRASHAWAIEGFAVAAQRRGLLNSI